MKSMMKLLAVLFCSGLMSTAGALEKKNIPYYDPEFPQSGNRDYLKAFCKLDLRIPKGQTNFPTLVWLHGGGLRFGGKHYPGIIHRGKIAVAAVDYRLSGPKAQCPDYIYDAAAAVAWVLKHIKEYGGNPQQVYVSGHSAGGYLSAMLALDAKYLKTFGVKPQQLAGVLPLSGQMTTHFQVLNERRAQNPQTPKLYLDEYAPIFIANAKIPPMVLITGDPEVEWPSRVEENLLLAARLRRNYHAKQVKCVVLPSFNHGTMLTPGLAVVNEYILKAQKKLPKR